jgi:CheY-like chemotaxis protein
MLKKLKSLFATPAAPAEAPPPGKKPASAAPPGAAPIVPPTGKTILVVDDNPVVLKALSLKLEANGYRVLTAAEGAEAVGVVRRDKPDLILLDLGFPPDIAHGGSGLQDGFHIMRWLQRLEEAKHIPIIIITGGDPEKLKERALAAGAVSFFRKPIDSAELIEVIRRTLAGTNK